MLELFHLAFSTPNIVYTVLLLLVIIYWLSVIIGAMHIGSLDMDFDFDADFDADFDVDHHVEMDGHTSLGLAGILHFFNFGKLPFMIIMSFIILFAWAGSVLGNLHLGNGSWLVPFALFFPNLFLSLCLTKFITTPLIPVFKNLDHSEAPVDYIGMHCDIILPASKSKAGQAKVLLENSPLLIQVKLAEEDDGVLPKGAKAIVIRKEANTYIIRKQKLSQ